MLRIFFASICMNEIKKVFSLCSHFSRYYTSNLNTKNTLDSLHLMSILTLQGTDAQFEFRQIAGPICLFSTHHWAFSIRKVSDSHPPRVGHTSAEHREVRCRLLSQTQNKSSHLGYFAHGVCSHMDQESSCGQIEQMENVALIWVVFNTEMQKEAGSLSLSRGRTLRIFYFYVEEQGILGREKKLFFKDKIGFILNQN